MSETETYPQRTQRELLERVTDLLASSPTEGRVTLLASDASPFSALLMIGDKLLPCMSIDVSIRPGDLITATVEVAVDDLALFGLDIADLTIWRPVSARRARWLRLTGRAPKEQK